MNGNHEHWSDRNGWFLDIVRNYIIISTLQELGLLWIWRPIVFLFAILVGLSALVLPKIAIPLLIFSFLLSLLPLIGAKKRRMIIEEKRRIRRFEKRLDKEATEEMMDDFSARCARSMPTYEEEYNRQLAYAKEQDRKKREGRNREKSA